MSMLSRAMYRSFAGQTYILRCRGRVSAAYVSRAAYLFKQKHDRRGDMVVATKRAKRLARAIAMTTPFSVCEVALDAGGTRRTVIFKA